MEQKMSKDFIKKIANVQNGMKVDKSKHNDYSKFFYRTVEDIYATVRPLLTENSLAIKITDDLVDISGKLIIKATATITDGENEFSNTAYAGIELDKKGMDRSQIFGSASTYARKYALGGLLLVGGEDDPDSKDNRQKNTKNTQPKTQKPQQEAFEISSDDRQKITDFLLNLGVSEKNIQARLQKITTQAEVDSILFEIEKGAN